MTSSDLSHLIADCQFQDGSVSVEWQGVEGEGTQEAHVGNYKSLREALEAHPEAYPVCFDCEPWPTSNIPGVAHEPGCTYKTDGCESALEKEGTHDLI